MTKFFPKREELPQWFFPVIPFLLFFPKGVRGASVIVFLLLLVIAGRYREKYLNIRQSPMFLPTMFMLGVSILGGLLLDNSDPKFWVRFGNYQIYLFLLLFISMGGGDWQRKARIAFLAGAVMAATLFYLNALDSLPDMEVFQSYRNYAGNNSILMGILLAIAAPLVFYEAARSTTWPRRFGYLAAYLYIAAALLLFASTRTGAVLFILLNLGVIIHVTDGGWRSRVALVTGLLIVIAVGWTMSPTLKARAADTVEAVKEMTSSQLVLGQGDARVELYVLTWELIREKPLTGHGIGQWVHLYKQKAQGLVTQHMVTPHNEYLLYAAELGVLGVLALLTFWAVQFVVALRIRENQGVYLGVITAAMVVGAMFNAVLRDFAFGIPFMVLLAISLAGIQRKPLG